MTRRKIWVASACMLVCLAMNVNAQEPCPPLQQPLPCPPVGGQPSMGSINPMPTGSYPSVPSTAVPSMGQPSVMPTPNNSGAPMPTTSPSTGEAMSPIVGMPSSAPETAAATAESSGSLFSGLSGASNYAGSNSTGVAGAGLASNADTGTNIPLSSPIPVILPGLLTAANSQAPKPMNRFFSNYSYYSDFRSRQTFGYLQATTDPVTGENSALPNVQTVGFDLHRFDVGIEKTIMCGKGSVYVSVPFLDAVNNTTGQFIDGVGNVNVGAKVLLWDRCDKLSQGAVGVTVSLPTGRDTRVVTYRTVDPSTDGPRDFDPPSPETFASRLVNPTFIQPYFTTRFGKGKMFVQNYTGVLFSDESELATFINNDLVVGYELYNNPCGKFFTSVTPLVSLQAFIPLSDRGTPQTPPILGRANFTVDEAPAPTFGFSDQLLVTPAVQWGLGERTSLTTGMMIPVTGPRGFDYGITVGLNYGF